MLIDCRSFDVTQIRLQLPTVAVAVCNTGVKHTLSNSAYNERGQECEHAVELLRERGPAICALRDLEIGDLDMIEGLPEPERRRARHVVTENERTVQAAKALEASDARRLGELMMQSHESLRDDFQVSSPELDIMFQLAQKQEYVLGARMMGGVFGGCTVNLVKHESLNVFTDVITDAYQKATGIVPSISIVHADEAVNESGFEAI